LEPHDYNRPNGKLRCFCLLCKACKRYFYTIRCSSCSQDRIPGKKPADISNIQGESGNIVSLKKFIVKKINLNKKFKKKEISSKILKIKFQRKI